MVGCFVSGCVEGVRGGYTGRGTENDEAWAVLVARSDELGGVVEDGGEARLVGCLPLWASRGARDGSSGRKTGGCWGARLGPFCKCPANWPLLSLQCPQKAGRHSPGCHGSGDWLLDLGGRGGFGIWRRDFEVDRSLDLQWVSSATLSVPGDLSASSATPPLHPAADARFYRGHDAATSPVACSVIIGAASYPPIWASSQLSTSNRRART